MMEKALPSIARHANRSRQRGVALPLVAAGLVALLAIAGLALDTGHALANKTRLQNTVDAAALAAAKQYDQNEDIIMANAFAMAVFGLNADGVGNHELNTAFDGNEINVVIQWSETLDPFVSTGIGPYVRVIATGFDLDSTLTSVIGINEIPLRASAVAGPSPTINNACNIAPMVVCAEDPDDTATFGFTTGEIEVLKSPSGGSEEIGPGNFQLIRLDCPGGACVRDNMAGGYEGCVGEGDSVETEPGNTVGPTVQGINTRFGTYSGPISPGDYPPDVVTNEPSPAVTYDDATETVQQSGATVTAATLDYGWSQYQSDVVNGNYNYAPPVGVYERRVLKIPMARCDGALSGQGTLPVVGFACYFLMQQAVQKGNESQIYGQFINACSVNGVPGPAPVAGPNPYVIQLYKDPDSSDS